MYRTATLAVYDVLDTVFINAVITEYSETPGTVAPLQYVYSTSVQGRGEDDRTVWLWEALQGLQRQLDQP
jgi:hypothetical protein